VPDLLIGDYRRLPIHDSARLRADRWDASLLTLPEWQCRPHRSDHGDRRSPVRLSEEIDPATQQVIRHHTHREWQARERHHLYGRARSHPPDYATHTWPGFSTANCDGSIERDSTHIKMG
jgi:hypothetical protein